MFYYGLVETAGGLQLVVDAGVPVDSALIRQYVNEVLADIIALTLGQREGPREPPAPASTQDTHIQQVNGFTQNRVHKRTQFYSLNNFIVFPSVLIDPVLMR